MMKLISRIILFLIGWKIKGEVSKSLKKCVIIAAPHTSNSDFFIGRMGFYILGLKHVRFLIKKEAFKFPFGMMLRKAGGLAIDRRNSNKTINEIVESFKKNQQFYLVVTPEGTRKKTNNWKMGFYHIAKAANVPIALCYVDYKKKEGGVTKIIDSDNSKDEILNEIYEFYRNINAKFPENFNLSPNLDS